MKALKNIVAKRSPKKRLAPRRSGNVILLTGFSLVVMLGFAALAVDYGISVNTKNRLQRTCDAAALANYCGAKRDQRRTSEGQRAQLARQSIIRGRWCTTLPRFVAASQVAGRSSGP